MSLVEPILAGVLLVLVGALFLLALAETSLVHVRRSAVAVDADAGDAGAARLLALLDDLPRVMNAVLLLVLLAQVTAATLAGFLARNWLGGAGVTVATAAVTMVLFVYGEAIPKTIAVRRPYATARKVAGPVRAVGVLLRPVVSALVVIADAQTRGSGIDPVGAVSEAELRHLAEDAASAGRIDESDADLIERSFVFGDLEVGEVRVPRDEIVAVSSATAVSDALRIAIEAGHRRLPVYDGGIDRIIGFVRMRDLAAPTVDPDSAVGTLLREALEVPQSISLVEMLRLMQRRRIHLAVVADEDGGTAGIVTIEDVAEELVGSIDDD